MKDRQQIEQEITDKLAIIRALDQEIAEKRQEAEAQSSIIIQRRMDIGTITMQAATHNAVVGMFRSRYGHEIATGQHDGKTVAHLTLKYMARERNLMQGLTWRCSLARTILGDTLDRVIRTKHQPVKQSQFKQEVISDE